MYYIYLTIIFLFLFFINYKILNFFNVKIFLSNIAISIIISLLITKIIYNTIYIHQNNNTKEQKKLLVGLSPDYPPYASIDDNKIIGLDIDILEIIAKKLNLELQLLPMPFHSILVSLQLNNIDIAASGLSGSDERKKQMLISIPYFKNNLCAISLKQNSFNSLSELKNKKIIINTGYTSERYIEKKSLTNEIIKLKSVPDALIGLELNQGDVFITSYASLIQFLKTKESEKFFILNLPDSQNEESVSFLINKNNIELLNQINKIIKELDSSKDLKKILNKWGLE